MKRSILAGLAVLAVLVVATATAMAVTTSGRSGGTDGFRMHGMMSGPAGTDDGWRPGMRQWMRGAAVGTEFGYLTRMVAHHEEAVAAASELARSERPRMRAFGASIVASQSAQIEQMKSWLATWYPGRDTKVDYRPMMRDLTGLSGDRLDRTFLEDMIPHHMMAVMMSQRLLMRGVAEHEQVNRLAESIRDEQHAEIFRMQRWLASWFDGGGWRHGRATCHRAWGALG